MSCEQESHWGLSITSIGLLLMLLITNQAYAVTITASPADYLDKLSNLHPGDTLLLDGGVYDNPNAAPGLPIFDLNGEPGNPITIMGSESGSQPVFYGNGGTNTVRLSNASYIVLRNFVVDSKDLGGDGINSQGISHHITIENIIIVHPLGIGQLETALLPAPGRVCIWVIPMEPSRL